MYVRLVSALFNVRYKNTIIRLEERTGDNMLKEIEVDIERLHARMILNLSSLTCLRDRESSCCVGTLMSAAV